MTVEPSPEIIRAAVGLAIRAPSVHNTQPWRFRFSHGGLHLHADPARHLPATDPNGRDLIVSCGAALHHLRVALAALGWLPVTYRLPDPRRPHHLAVVATVPQAPTHAELSLAATIPHRHSDRRAYLPTTLDTDTITELTHQAAAHGTALRVIPEGGHIRSVLVSAIAEATMLQRANPSYVYELARWTGTRTGATDGVPSAHAPSTTALGDLTLRRFSAPRLHPLDTESTGDGAGTLLALGTTDDDQLSRIAQQEVIPAAPADYLAWRIEAGEQVDRFPDATQSWAQLLADATADYAESLPAVLQRRKHFLPLFIRTRTASCRPASWTPTRGACSTGCSTSPQRYPPTPPRGRTGR